MTLPTNRTTANTAAEHVADHNTVHGFVNDHQADPAAHSGTYAPAEILGGTVVLTVPFPVQWATQPHNGADAGAYVRCFSRGTINAVRLRVGAQSGNISVAAYRADGTNGLPSTRLATTGAIACPAVGMADLALGSSVTLEVGDWLFFSADNTTVTLAVTTTSGDNTLFEGLAYQQLAAHPAPSTAGTLAVKGYRTPILTGVNV